MTARAWRRVPVMLLAGLIAGWFMAVRPELAERAAAEQAADVLASQLAAHRTAAAGVDAWRERVQRLHQRIDAHPMRLPRQPDLSGLLTRVADMATATGSRLVGVEPGEVSETPDYRQRAVTLRLTGRWEGLTRLLARLGRETRSVTVTRLDMAGRPSQTDGPPLTLTVTVMGHWRRADGPTNADAEPGGWLASSPAPAPDTPATRLRNPFQPPAGRPESDPAGLTYLGRITQGERVWALIRDAGGRIHHRRPGASLPGGGRLQRVTPTAITITRPGGAGAPQATVRRRRIGLDHPGG